jgi:hypothetical protein
MRAAYGFLLFAALDVLLLAAVDIRCLLMFRDL